MGIAVLNAMPSPRHSIRRNPRRGFTLLKILVAIAVVSLLGIAATMWLPEICVCTKTPNAPAGTDAAALAAAAEAFIIGHGSEECPTPDEMQRDGFLSSRSNTEDPWGTPYRIQCEPEHVVVVSAGPDLVFDTEDDISSGQR
jgi:general secretion pathway protein G